MLEEVPGPAQMFAPTEVPIPTEAVTPEEEPMPTPEITRLAAMLRKADAVVIAASNGFDIADGYNQFACDETFLQRFGDFHAAYGLNSMLHGLAARWPSDEARWAFLARLISYGYAAYEPSEVMRA